jgi:hypothetical protein
MMQSLLRLARAHGATQSDGAIDEPVLQLRAFFAASLGLATTGAHRHTQAWRGVPSSPARQRYSRRSTRVVSVSGGARAGTIRRKSSASIRAILFAPLATGPAIDVEWLPEVASS